MKPIPSTIEILAYKVLNRNVGETWINWAVNMLMEGFDTEYLVELTGASPLDNQFELQALSTKVLHELNLDYTDKDQIIKSYTCYLIGLALSGHMLPIKVLDIFQKLYIELDYESYLSDFYYLYFAKKDLINDEMQWYWMDADKNNIDSIIHNYFVQWLSKNAIE